MIRSKCLRRSFQRSTDFTSAVEDFREIIRRRKHLQLVGGLVKSMQENLIIDKFMGDCVMSFKGGNLVDGTPAEHTLAWCKQL